MQAVTPQQLEKHVFAKPWFDRHGLIIATEGARPIGFVHAGFGANDGLTGIDQQQGTTCLLQVAPHPDRGEIASELLSASEDYLRRSGATQVFAGAQSPFNPFYLGFYGSSDVPGVLASDTAWTSLLAASGYKPLQRRLLLHRSLSGFRAPVDRQQMQVRRRFQVSAPVDIIPDNWWEACVWSPHEWTRLRLTLRDAREAIVSATFWEIEPLARSWGVQSIGLVRLDDTPEARSEGLTTFLLAEALRFFQSQGLTQFEAQAEADDASLIELFTRLGLTQHDEAALWVKPG